MFQGKQLVTAAAIMALIVAGTPQSADASLIGVSVLGEMFVNPDPATDPADLTTPDVSQIQVIMGGADPDWEVDEPGPVGKNTVNFDVVYDSTQIGDNPALPVPSLSIGYEPENGTEIFQAKTWRFSGIEWLGEPGDLAAIQFSRLESEPGATFTLISASSFAISLPEIDFSQRPAEDTAFWFFNLFARHESPNGDVPEPGTLLLLGAGLLGLSRVRHRR